MTIRRPALRGFLALMSTAAALGAQAAPAFPTQLSGNTTGFDAARFLGAPDDIYLGLGADSVTYDFGSMVVANRPGAVDINVYEVDTGGPEFQYMNILVSQDGIAFFSLKSSESALVRIAGDGTHANNSFGRSYNLGNLAWARYVRIQGTGAGRAGGANYFDLDAIGAHDVMPAPVPEPATWLLMLAGLVGIGRMARRPAATRV